MPMQHNIFYETQSGGLCRMHSINGYFGTHKISQSQFQEYIKKYDIEYKKKYNFDSSCLSFDLIASDQKNIVNFILKQFGIYSRYFALNQLYRKPLSNITDILEGHYFFIYNEGHIWGCRKYNDKWYKVDSLSGVTVININNILCEKNIGFIIPVNIKSEFYRNIKLIKNIINKTPTIDDIKKYLIQQNKDKKILGDLEIPVNLCMDILDNKSLSKNKEFQPIQIYVDVYNEFLSQFTNGNYNNINIILKYLPNIIFTLVSLSCI